MSILWPEISKKSNGGTEQQCRELEKNLPESYMSMVQIVPSRLDSFDLLDNTKLRILYLHDLPNDPASDFILKNEGWKKFHKIVCVSNWQMQAYIAHYQIPWSRCCVIQNSIKPINISMDRERCNFSKKHPLKVVYTPTPHRGLDVLQRAWANLLETEPAMMQKCQLNVFSSFDLYGWGERDKEFKQMFDWFEKQETVIYYGTIPNEELRFELGDSDIFAYPSTWFETSCRCLMEAMSAGLVCIHSNLGALPETAANFTQMYQFHEDKAQHAIVFRDNLKIVIEALLTDQIIYTSTQKNYADTFYNVTRSIQLWKNLIMSLKDEPREAVRELAPVFSYHT